METHFLDDHDEKLVEYDIPGTLSPLLFTSYGYLDQVTALGLSFPFVKGRW